MLVLTRKPNERIVLGEGIVITVVSCRAGRVRIGIEAPSRIPITRLPPVTQDSRRKPLLAQKG